MNRNLLAGLAAGAAGATALNAVTYADMALRGRPPSTTPEETVARVEELTGRGLPGGEQVAGHRRSGLGALLGLVTGTGVGLVYGLVRSRLDRAPALLLVLGAAVAANVGSAVPMALLGVTDVRDWDADAWLSDLVPHLAYGATTAATWELLSGK
ncbi:hypothetical protein [Amycolatopsis sp. FDAARGOS 1241]|uniref:hypothetical protein n=1 Tax=Amycolatopsis sp. FDAARGOS 1241 TaxID=2778070 RepID=UPI00194E417C|nr:hypothetical protein [Amycolatopsis sp. FDAARGOS 1241]QRP50081.1 hypothetical protein I6J71_21600 [Amycolatopsis sp. FDAARGOS 1241]